MIVDEGESGVIGVARRILCLQAGRCIEEDLCFLEGCRKENEASPSRLNKFYSTRHYDDGYFYMQCRTYVS